MASPTPIGTPATYSSASVGTVHNFSCTVPATGQNRGLIVIAYDDGGATYSSVTYNGDSMTDIVSVAGTYEGNGRMFYLANPDTGSAFTVSITITTSRNVNAFAFALQDIVQSSPVDVTGAWDGLNTGTSETISVVTTVNNDIVIGWIIVRNGAASLTNSDGTLISSLTGSGFPGLALVSYKEKATAGSESLSYSWTNNAAHDTYITSLKYLAPSGGAAPQVHSNLLLMGVG